MAVDIGSEAINQAYSQSPTFTTINRAKPAEVNGIITSIDIWASVEMAELKVGTFYTTNGNTLKCRASFAVEGIITVGSKVTKAVSIVVEIGDYIGYSTLSGEIDISIDGGAGVWQATGDFCTPDAETGYSLKPVYGLSLGGYIEVPPDPPTNVAATENQSDKVVITWNKSDGANDYQVKRDGVGLDWIGDLATYDDSAADAPLITAGASVAGDGVSTAHVALSLDGTSVANGTTHTYVVEARLDGGESSGDSGSDTGYREASALTYQWQRSDGDSDANYNTNLGTSSTYDDTGAPAPTITAGTGAATDGLTAYVTLSLSGESANVGAGRYYQCVLVSTDASNTPATATANRGYRGVGSLTYQWEISAGDSDADYSEITDATTEPYNHAVAHIDGRYYKCVENATGAGQQTSAVDRGWRKPLEVTDGDLIGIRIIRKS